MNRPAADARRCRVRREPLRRAPLVLLAVFLLLLSIGIAVDEPARVLEQARTICLECMGIG